MSIISISISDLTVYTLLLQVPTKQVQKLKFL